MNLLRKLEGYIVKIESFLVILLLLILCLLAFLQVVLRNLFSFSFVWADIFVRMAVLWVAILGASIATSERGHIHIDLLSRVIPSPYNKYLDALLSLVATGACFFFTLIALKFVSVEKEVGSVIHLLWGAPEWIFTLIFPAGFLLMTFKFLLCFLTELAVTRERRVSLSLLGRLGRIARRKGA
jgi:TRAP-type C4-dicarboxylate transport system permease small subunit